MHFMQVGIKRSSCKKKNNNLNTYLISVYFLCSLHVIYPGDDLPADENTKRFAHTADPADTFLF